MKVTFDKRDFEAVEGSWDDFLDQLHIPGIDIGHIEKRKSIEKVELNVADFTAIDINGNELTI